LALARLKSRGQSGLLAYEVSVEVHTSGGLPAFTITGLPTAAVRESRERVRAALLNSGFEWPSSRITAHLGPADIPKDGGRFDLAIALGIIVASGRRRWKLDEFEFIAELTLGGELRPVTGIVPAALAVRGCSRRLVISAGNAAEAGLVPGVDAVSATSLAEVVSALRGKAALTPVVPRAIPPSGGASPDLAEVRGLAGAKRALAIAAAGNHNLLMIGPPGSGKSMLSARLPGLLPPLADDELLEVASIASVAGDGSVLERGRRRPLRAPHHTIRAAALVGGGNHPKPGEISLAHRGVLFLDELPEFQRTALEALREPLETGRVAISRLGHRIEFPAGFQLVAAMNPCPCGYLGDGTDRCRCGAARVHAYRGRISGPLLERFDLHIEVPRIEFAELAADADSESSACVRTRVEAARERQWMRGALNTRLGEQDALALVRTNPAMGRLLRAAQTRWQFSARSIVRILRVSQTLADLDGLERAGVDQLSEALQLRRLDRPPGGDTV